MIRVIQCHNNLWGTEYSSTQEKWNSFIVAAVLELFLKLWIFVITLNNIFVAVHFIAKSRFVVFVIGK